MPRKPQPRRPKLDPLRVCVTCGERGLKDAMVLRKHGVVDSENWWYHPEHLPKNNRHVLGKYGVPMPDDTASPARGPRPL